LWDREVLDYHRQLIALRHTYPALRIGDYKILCAEQTLYSFARTLADEALIVAVNVGTEPAQTTLKDLNTQLRSQPSRLLYGSGDVSWSENHLHLSIPARKGLVLG
jgi:cyclomaltodextrinase / maltogenic alpha-amylase / neopullulanase